MANTQSLPIVATVQVSFTGDIVEVGGPDLPETYKNSGQVVGNSSLPAGSRSIVENTTIGVANENLAHVCDFISEMQKNINLKKYTKAIANQIREAIREIMKALGFSDATGEVSSIIQKLKDWARELKRIQKEIVQPIQDFQQYVLAYITKIKALIQWILSLPDRFIAMLKECLDRLLKLVSNVFTDIGQGFSEGFGGDSQISEIITEAKNTASAAVNLVTSTAAAVVSLSSIPLAATAGILTPVSQADLDAANQAIASYESPTAQISQNKSTP